MKSSTFARMALPAFVLAVALTLTPNPSQAQHSPASSEHTLKIGEKAPAIQLKDQHGNTQTLSALTKKGAVAIVFHRSADW